MSFEPINLRLIHNSCPNHRGDHLMQVSEAGIAALAGSDTVAVLLPGTSFFLWMKAFRRSAV